MPKQTAIDSFLKDIYTITVSQDLDIYIVNKEIAGKLLTKHGISKEDIKHYIVMETGSNIYFDKRLLASKFKDEVSVGKFLSSLIDTVRGRLPHTIQSVTSNVPIRISKQMKTLAKYNITNKEIVVSNNYIINIMKDPSADIVYLLHDIGHELWHAFSNITNFKENLKGMIKEKAKIVIGSKVNSLEELSIHLNFIEELTEGHVLDLFEKEYVDRWGTKYINDVAKSTLENSLYKHVDKAIIRGSLDEMMADSLGNIVAGTKPKVTNRGVNFILQRLASNAKQLKVEALLSSVDENNSTHVMLAAAQLLTLMNEDCDDCGL